MQMKQSKQIHQKKHPDYKIMFWPDVAIAHYAAREVPAFHEFDIIFIKQAKMYHNYVQLKIFSKILK